MDFFSINNVMVNIPLGEGGYALSWIEAIGTVFGLLCIWCASREKIINYLFGLINVTLFAAIFFQIQLYASLLLQVFFFAANIYGWYAWSRQNEAQEATLKVRWLSRQQTLVLSIAAMVLMTRKFVENWLLWVVIDVISVVIYAVQGVYAMSLEYVLLTAIAVMGSYSWIKSAQRNGYAPLAAAGS